MKFLFLAVALAHLLAAAVEMSPKNIFTTGADGVAQIRLYFQTEHLKKRREEDKFIKGMTSLSDNYNLVEDILY